MKKIAVYADYVCPFCLLAEARIERIIGGRDIEIEWRPFELRPDPVPTLRPEDPYLPAIWRKSVYPLAASQGVSIRLPTISPQPRTAKAFEILQLATDRGLGHPYSMRVLKAFFQEDQDIGNTDVLVQLASESGLESYEVRAALEDGTYSGRHQAALAAAREMRIDVVPTIVIGEQVFRGTPSDDALSAAIDDLDSSPADTKA